MIDQGEKRKRLIQNVVLAVATYLVYITNRGMSPVIFWTLVVTVFCIGVWNQFIRDRDWEDYDDE